MDRIGLVLVLLAGGCQQDRNDHRLDTLEQTTASEAEVGELRTAEGATVAQLAAEVSRATAAEAGALVAAKAYTDTAIAAEVTARKAADVDTLAAAMMYTDSAIAKVAPGPPGPKGDVGPQGAPGPVGPKGPGLDVHLRAVQGNADLGHWLGAFVTYHDGFGAFIEWSHPGALYFDQPNCGGTAALDAGQAYPVTFVGIALVTSDGRLARITGPATAKGAPMQSTLDGNGNCIATSNVVRTYPTQIVAAQLPRYAATDVALSL